MGFAPKFAFWFASWLTIILVGIYVPNPTPNILRFPFFLLGLFFLSYGLLLNAIAGRTLKKFGHFHITKGIKKPEKLVTQGIYSCMRHPAQFGSIIFGVGISFITTNLYAILLAGWFSFLALYFILAIEERETLRNFGDGYCQFLRERKPFTLSISCLLLGIRALKEGNEAEEEKRIYKSS